MDLLMIPGILLDRDGTINVDYHYVGHIERVQLIDGAADAIARFNRAGIPVAIVTNQSGVARGFYTENNVKLVHDYIARELALHGAHVDLFLYSPHHPDGTVDEYISDSIRHKPNPGMAYQAARMLNLDLRASVVVGDRFEDMLLAQRIESHGIYIGAEPLHGLRTTPIRFPSLADAAGYIIERLTGMTQSEFPTMNYTGIPSFFTHYTDEVANVMRRLSFDQIGHATDTLSRAHTDGSFIFTAGNGGSAAIANHMETDHIKRIHGDHGWFTNVRSLSANNSLMTAAANDIGFDSMFSWQLERFANPHDVLVCFSVSGRSSNIIRAIQQANEMNIRTIAIVACDGGEAAGLAEVAIHIPTGNYGVAEDVMSIVMHSIVQFLQQSRMSDHAIQFARF